MSDLAPIIVVEGLTDQRRYKFLVNEAMGGVDVSVHCVDNIHIPEILCSQHGYPLGNRGRVLALAKTLETSTFSGRFLYIVDSDADYISGTPSIPQNVIRTEFPDFESYFVARKDLLTKFFKNINQADRFSIDSHVDSILKISWYTFLLRVTLNTTVGYTGWNARWAKTSVGARLDGLELNKEDCVRPMLGGNIGRAREVVERADTLANAHPKRDCFVHGHDFCDLLGVSCKLATGLNGFSDPKVAFASLSSTVGCEPFSGTSLQRAIGVHVGATC